MKSAPEFNTEMFSIALAEKLKNYPDFEYVPKAFNLVCGKPVELDGKKWILELTPGEKQDWLEAVDEFVTKFPETPAKKIVDIGDALVDAYGDKVPSVDFTSAGGVKKKSLLGAASTEMGLMWADHQPIH